MGEVPKQLKPFVFKKGNKLGGRKKGKTLKEYARNYLSKMTEEERISFLNSLDPEIVWKMAEGNPPQKNTFEGKVELAKPIYESKSISRHPSNPKGISTKEKD